MITIKKIQGAFKTSYTLIDDATGLNVGLAKGKNWLIKRNAWNLCNNKDYLTKCQIILFQRQMLLPQYLSQ